MMGPAVAHGMIRPLVLILSWVLSPVVSSEQRPNLENVGFDLGDPNAPLLVVEFADFGCAACAQFAIETFPIISEQLIGSGQVRWKVIPFELGAFKRSKEATVAAICASEQGEFWRFHDSLFVKQGEWQRMRNPQAMFEAVAATLGLEAAAFVQCYESDEAEEHAKELRELARRSSVRGTPTFLIEGEKLEGAPPVDAFVELLTRRR